MPPILSFLIWMPIVSGLVIFFIGKKTWTKIISLIFSAIPLVGAVSLLLQFDSQQPGFQFSETLDWIPAISVYYKLGVDGLSVFFVFLTALVTFLAVLASGTETNRAHQYFAAFMILSGLTSGVFSALDGLLFYIFFEVTLIPMFFIIGIWGGPNRIYAALKFFLYTLLGSLLSFLAILYLYIQSGSFSIIDWYLLPLTFTEQVWIFLAFLAGFAVKIPMWPLHTWLPDAHVEAPTAGSIVLAAVMLKLGGYGFIRFLIPIAPDASHFLAPVMLVLALIAVVYVGLVAMVQVDMKKLVAYSSIAHMGFAVLGLFLFNEMGFSGAIIQMISHGFVSAGMFFCIGVLYDRVHSRKVDDYGGVVNVMPKFASFFLFLTMANAGLPSTSGFVGEFFVIIASVQKNFWLGAIAGTTLIWGAVYSLRMYKSVMWGPILKNSVAHLLDLNKREFCFLLIVSFLVLALGLYPKIITKTIDVSTQNWLNIVNQSKLT